MKYIPEYAPNGMDKKIGNAQAWNLAVACLDEQGRKAMVCQDKNSDITAKQELEELQEYFFNKLYTEPMLAWRELHEKSAGEKKSEEQARDGAENDVGLDVPDDINLLN